MAEEIQHGGHIFLSSRFQNPNILTPGGTHSKHYLWSYDYFYVQNCFIIPNIVQVFGLSWSYYNDTVPFTPWASTFDISSGIVRRVLIRFWQTLFCFYLLLCSNWKWGFWIISNCLEFWPGPPNIIILWKPIHVACWI